MTGPVYLDTGIFIAFLNRRDQWHAQAVTLFSTAKPGLRSSMVVVSEAYSWFLHRMGEESARAFLRLLEKLPALHLYESTRKRHDETVKILNRFRGSKLTYADGSSLHLIEQNHIPTVWATDHHLGLTGATILPRS